MQFKVINNKECLHSPSSQRFVHVCTCVGIPHAHEIVWRMYRRRFSDDFVVAAHSPDSSPPKPLGTPLGA